MSAWLERFADVRLIFFPAMLPPLTWTRFPAAVRYKVLSAERFLLLNTALLIFAVRLPSAWRFPKASEADVFVRSLFSVTDKSLPLEIFPVSGIESACIEKFLPLCKVAFSISRCCAAATEISPFPAIVPFWV